MSSFHDDRLMRGNENWQTLADELHVRYLFWGRNEDDTYPDSPQPWREETRRVAFGEWGAIYDLQTPAPAAAVAPAE